MIPIKNLEDYTTKMNFVMKDKLFFVDKIKTRVYIDYGCADGTLLSELDAIYQDPSVFYIGYDQSKEMIDLAKSKWGGIGNIMFSSNFEDVLNAIHTRYNDTTLILSSVLHEILSQGITQDEFWETITRLPLKYIVIRDMAFNPIICSTKLDRYLISKIYNNNPKQYSDFAAKFGKIVYSTQFCHYLLKYRYTQNWQRELQEDYFAFDPDVALECLKQYNFYCTYFERFNVPYIVNVIQKDLQIDLNQFGQTHIKMILQKC